MYLIKFLNYRLIFFIPKTIHNRKCYFHVFIVVYFQWKNMELADIKILVYIKIDLTARFIQTELLVKKEYRYGNQQL